MSACFEPSEAWAPKSARRSAPLTSVREKAVDWTAATARGVSAVLAHHVARRRPSRRTQPSSSLSRAGGRNAPLKKKHERLASNRSTNEYLQNVVFPQKAV